MATAGVLTRLVTVKEPSGLVSWPVFSETKVYAACTLPPKGECVRIRLEDTPDAQTYIIKSDAVTWNP